MTITINSDKELKEVMELFKGSCITINVYIQKVGNITDSTVSDVNVLKQCKQGER